MRHNQLLMEKVYESVAPVAPITAIVPFLSITIAQSPQNWMLVPCTRIRVLSSYDLFCATDLYRYCL
ncbi:MAG: hypothetical protein HFJ10_15980 [Lachnospiraceae bacterium]|jgi:hypothetical protein|nr:hypothetical protein [Lachnospiraceae bacterium]